MPPEEWKLDDVKRANCIWKNYGERIADTEIQTALQSRLDVQSLTGAMPYAGIGRILKYIQKQTEKRKGEERAYNLYTGRNDTNLSGLFAVSVNSCILIYMTEEILFPKDLSSGT